jgi:hypothetical protein
MESNIQRPLAPGAQQQAGLPIFEMHGTPQERDRESSPVIPTQKRVACKQCRQAKVQYLSTRYLLGSSASRHIQGISSNCKAVLISITMIATL